MREVALRIQIEVRGEDDVVRVSQAARDHFRAARLSLAEVDTGDLVVRELAWNLVHHAGGGTIDLEPLHEGDCRGLVVTSTDNGPGMSTMGRHPASQEGLGIGVRAVHRHSNEFTLVSRAGQGTTIRAVLWWP